MLLDETWYALNLDGVIRLFDVAQDPGMVNDLAAAQPGLASRAAAVCRSLGPGKENPP